MQHLSIGAVAKLTAIPAHTLRKWESRHGIAQPTRSPTGRRVYTHEQVDQLKLIKHLVANGHALSHLKALTHEELQQLAGLHDKSSVTDPATSLILVGPNIARRLTGQPNVRQRVSTDLESWLATSPDIDSEDTLVVEATTIPPALASKLIQLQERTAALFVCYTFAAAPIRAQLGAADVRLLSGRSNDDELALHLRFTPDAPDSQRPRHRFATEELARIAALSPGLQCECPNHIAQILMDITSFEQYSAQCEDTDPAARALHDELGAISARARALFEDALVAVAAADGIALDLKE